MMLPSIALVTTPTRLHGLLARWGTKGAAKFRVSQALMHASITSLSSLSQPDRSKRTTATLDESDADAAFSQYEQEDKQYHASVEKLRQEINVGFPITVVEKRYLANFDFRNVMVVIVVGHDGLVANTAKYATGLPIIGVNPDPSRNDGVLTPFGLSGVRATLQRTLRGKSKTRSVSLAEASLNDGQTMLAFNDFFIGKRSHTSARYTIRCRGQSEPQSSSGVLVATGAGSTGWLSSVFNMAQGVSQWTGGQSGDRLQLGWEDRQLAWVVREPFASKHSRASMVAGTLNDSDELALDSMMPDSGVVFSDGIEDDFMEFNSGSTVKIKLARACAQLVVPG
jgi:hypothetical protein